MIEISLGQRIHELRDKADLSLRKLANQIGISGPFPRAPIADLKRLMDSNPKLGFAFRTVVEKVKNGELTSEDIIVKLSKRKSRA